MADKGDESSTNTVPPVFNLRHLFTYRDGAVSRWLRLVAYAAIILMVIVGAGYAAPVGEREAGSAAANWARVKGVGRGKGMPAIGEASPGLPLYGRGRRVGYLYEDAEAGFVVAGADDLLSPVLAYSEDTPFDPDVPVAALFLESVAVRLGRLEKQGAGRNPRWEAMFEDGGDVLGAGGRLGPLLTSTWSQGNPYNQMCPEDPTHGDQRSVVGCVATATAQIMRFHGHPLRGVGSHSYYWPRGGIDLYADFDTTYSWGDMPDRLTVSSPQAEIDAVAKLSYHCGVSVNMQYSATGSSASLNAARNALSNYFLYLPSSQYVYRRNYTDGEWFSVMDGEISASQPVLYGVFTQSGGGHGIVLDGTDDSGGMYVHLNMGWGGYSDGWYSITDFTFGGNDWNYNHQGAIGIKPDPATIQNSPPSFTDAMVTPEPAYETSTLSASCAGWSDADGDPEGYHYQWKKNGVEIGGETSATLGSGNFDAGDSVSCSATAWDGIEEGNTIETGAILIEAWGIAPADPEVSVGEYLHFSTSSGTGALWSFVSSESGGSIQQDNGLYQAGGTPGDDVVMGSVGGEPKTTTVTVTASPRRPGVVGPATSMDVNGNGLGMSDVILMLKFVVGVDTPTAEQVEAGDFDLDGGIGLSDVTNALRIVVGLEPIV